jgi:macrolide-specific efflux system membrane fusion protein
VEKDKKMSVTPVRTSDDKARPAGTIPPTPGPKRDWRIFATAALAVIAGGIGYWQFGGSADPATIVATAPVARGDVIDTVSALGNLQPRDYVDLGAQVSGQLKIIHVDVGQEVKKGDLLAEIDPVVLNAKVEAGRASLASLRAQLLDKEAQRDLANQTMERQRKLLSTKAVSETTFETAEANSRSAAAQVDMLKAQIQQTESTQRGDEATLGYTKIFAPMNGTVVAINVRQGQTLNTNQSAPIIMRIADLSTMTVWTQVAEADVPKLKIGMTGEFTTLGSGNRRWSGKLRQILPTPEVVNNVVLYTALFDVENPQGELMTQMSAQVYFIVAEAKNVLTVPVSALKDQRRTGKTSVQVKTSFGTETREVVTGVRTRVMAEVKSGLKEGEEIVTGGAGGGSGEGGGGGRQRRQPQMRLQ